MKEFVEKLIERLEEENEKAFSKYREAFALCNEEVWRGRMDGLESAIEIVNQLAEEYGKDTNVTTKDCSKCSRRSWYQRGYADAEKNNGWIPCERELPKKSGKYIVTQKRYAIDDRIHKRPIAIEVDYVDFSAIDNEWCRAKFFEVIAWQPLPTPFVQK